MAFELAISPTTRSPGLGLKVNFLAQAQSPGTGALKGCIIAHANGNGSLAAGSILKNAASADDAADAFGPGMPGHLAAVSLFSEFGSAQVDLVGATAPSGATATATCTFDDTSQVTSAVDVTLEIAGRSITIAWLPGETDVQAATKLCDAALEMDADLPVTLSNASGTDPAVTIDAKGPGTWGNDIYVYLTTANGAGGDVQLSGLSSNKLAGGTTEMNVTTALALIKSTEYDFIVIATSSTDAANGGNSSNPGRLRTHMITYGEGVGALLQQGVIGINSTLSTALVGTDALNYERIQYAFCNKGQSLPAEWAGAEAGARMREESTDPAVNRINMAYRAQLYGAHDLVNDRLTAAQEETALYGGLSPIIYSSTGEPLPARPITTYFKDAVTGADDDRVLDTSRVSGLFAVSKDLRAALPQQFPNRKLSEDLPDGVDEIPPGVTEIREVKSFVIARCKYWALRKGVLNAKRLDQVIKDGTLIVRIDPDDESQVDIVLPLKTLRPLAKFSLVVQQVA